MTSPLADEVPGLVRAPSSEEIDRFWEQGVVHLPGVLAPQVVESLAEPLEGQIRLGGLVELSALSGDDSSSGFLAGIDHWRTDPSFARFATAGALPAIAAALLRSERIWLYEDSVLVKEPGADRATEFHTDHGYFHVDGDRLCTFWVPLDPADESSGAVRYVVGSHRDETDYRPNLFVSPDPIPGTVGEVVPEVDLERADRIVGFRSVPGDVVVHHARTIHGAPGNATADRRRRAVSVRYCGDGTTYRIRPGAPTKPHHGRVTDGDPLGGPDCPEVWPPA